MTLRKRSSNARLPRPHKPKWWATFVKLVGNGTPQVSALRQSGGTRRELALALENNQLRQELDAAYEKRRAVALEGQLQRFFASLERDPSIKRALKAANVTAAWYVERERESEEFRAEVRALLAAHAAIGATHAVSLAEHAASEGDSRAIAALLRYYSELHAKLVQMARSDTDA